VLDLAEGAYRQRMFKVDDKGEDELLSEVFPLKQGKPLDFIPFAIIGTGGRGDCIDEPPLIDLIDANIALYQINADYRHGLHFTGLPTPYVAGYTRETEGEQLRIGSTTAWIFRDAGAKVGFLEFTGTGLSELREAMMEKKQEMALLGARMIADETKQVETLGATQIKRSGENSVLSKIVQAVSQSLEWCLEVFADWAGQSGEIVYSINRDFLPTMLDGRTLTALIAAQQAGNLSKHSLFDLLQRGDVIEAGLTYEEEQSRIDADGPTMPAPAPTVPKDKAA
jgi:hypothetical protein